MKILPYILIVVVLLVAGGLYLQYRDGGSSILTKTRINTSDRTGSKINTDGSVRFDNQGAAPEFVGIDKWLNSDPLTMQSLRGKVVLIDFWTYSCINCIRTLPYVTQWYETYKDKGFVIVGVHTPEFAFEKSAANVQTALKRYSINYPVAQDNNYKTWNAYKNQFWPAHYLIDQEGDIVYTHFGEGKYDETEKAIRTLLGLEGTFEMPPAPTVNRAQTPEIYFGLSRLEAYNGPEKVSTDEQIYTLPQRLAKNTFALEGKWKFEPEAVSHTTGFGRIRLNFNAAKVFMVAQASHPVTVKVYVDGQLQKGVTVKDSDLYTLFESETGGQHTMDIEIPEGGFQAFTFTFG